jgi:S1-C subfamily serine protease
MHSQVPRSREAFGLNAARLGNSDQVQVGHTVIVIGSPRGLDQSVSAGIVSAIRDSGEGYKLFQTDAAASPGNSGVECSMTLRNSLDWSHRN